MCEFILFYFCHKRRELVPVAAPVCPMTAAAAALGSKSAPVGESSPGSDTGTLTPEAAKPHKYGSYHFLAILLFYYRT